MQQIGNLGQPLYRKQEPTGYSNAGGEWVNSAALLARMNFAIALAAGRIPGVKVDPSRFADRADLDQLAHDLMLNALTDQSRAAIEEALKSQAEAPIAGLMLGSPDFQRR